MNRRQQKKLSERLVEAATFGDSAHINALLRAGAHPETSDTEGTTPLYAASVMGATDNVLCLLAAGASPNSESGRGTEGTPCARQHAGATPKRCVHCSPTAPTQIFARTTAWAVPRLNGRYPGPAPKRSPCFSPRAPIRTTEPHDAHPQPQRRLS